MSTENGGPAFPNVPGGAGDIWQSWDQGMSLRDYFAAKAMPALIAHYSCRGEESLCGQYGVIALEAYRVSDAMLAARNKPR